MIALWAAAALATTGPATTDSNCPATSSADASVQGVTVTAKPDDTQTTVDRRSYKVSKDLNAQTGNVADLLRDIPAVQVDARGNPSLQGEGSVTILIDGRPSPQFSGESLGQALQAMPADRIDRIEVMTNPPAEYRSAGTGGIINLITKRPKGAGWSGSLRMAGDTLGGGSATASLGYNAPKLSVTGDLTYRSLPGWEVDTLAQTQPDPLGGGVIDSEDTLRERWTGNYWQANASAHYEPDARTQFTGSVRVSSNAFRTAYADRFTQDDPMDVLASALDDASRERSSYATGDALLSWRRSFGEAHDLTLAAEVSGSQTNDDRIDALTPTLPAGQAASSQQILWTNRLQRDRLTADYERPLAGGQLKLGYDFEYAPGRVGQAGGSGGPAGHIVLDPSQRDVFQATETDNGAYASYERRSGRLTILAGFRAENSHYALDQLTQGISASHDYRRLLPNLHLAYDLGGGRQLTASYSWRTNSPTDHQLDPFVLSRDPLHQQAGNPDLRPDDQSRYEVAFEDRHGDRTLTVTLFYHRRRNEMNEVYASLPDGAYLEETLNAGKGQRVGAEMTVGGKLSPKVSYSLSAVGYWSQFAPSSAPSASMFGAFPTRSAGSGFGHADLSWQVTPKDLLQLDVDTTALSLDPQGYSAPTYTGNIGFRHEINDHLAWVLTAKDPFHTLRYTSVEDILAVEDRRAAIDSSRSVSLSLVWSFAGKAKDQGIDFNPEGARR